MSAVERATRRDVLRAAFRTVCLAGLTAGAALLTWRNGRAACGRRTQCECCGARSRCDLASGSTARRR